MRKKFLKCSVPLMALLSLSVDALASGAVGDMNGILDETSALGDGEIESIVKIKKNSSRCCFRRGDENTKLIEAEIVERLTRSVSTKISNHLRLFEERLGNFERQLLSISADVCSLKEKVNPLSTRVDRLETYLKTTETSAASVTNELTLNGQSVQDIQQRLDKLEKEVAEWNHQGGNSYYEPSLSAASTMALVDISNVDFGSSVGPESRDDDDQGPRITTISAPNNDTGMPEARHIEDNHFEIEVKGRLDKQDKDMAILKQAYNKVIVPRINKLNGIVKQLRTSVRILERNRVDVKEGAKSAHQRTSSLGRYSEGALSSKLDVVPSGE